MAVLLPHLEAIVGIYLCGSHARNEGEPGSDIDVLVVANSPLRVSLPGFQIITIEESRFSSAIAIDPVLVYSLLAEAKPILNSELLLELQSAHKPRPKEFHDHVKSTRLIADVTDEALSGGFSDTCSGETAYPLLLRLRGLYIIQNLIKGRSHSKAGFLKWLRDQDHGIRIDKAIRAYQAVKRGDSPKCILKVDVQRLLGILKKQIVETADILNAKAKEAS